MDCNELVELVTAYLDDALDLEVRSLFDQHLLECDGCENYLQQMRITSKTLGAITAGRLDPEFRMRLLTAFSGWTGRSV